MLLFSSHIYVFMIVHFRWLGFDCLEVNTVYSITHWDWNSFSINSVQELKIDAGHFLYNASISFSYWGCC